MARFGLEGRHAWRVATEAEAAEVRARAGGDTEKGGRVEVCGACGVARDCAPGKADLFLSVDGREWVPGPAPACVPGPAPACVPGHRWRDPTAVEAAALRGVRLSGTSVCGACGVARYRGPSGVDLFLRVGGGVSDWGVAEPACPSPVPAAAGEPGTAGHRWLPTSAGLRAALAATSARGGRPAHLGDGDLSGCAVCGVLRLRPAGPVPEGVWEASYLAPGSDEWAPGPEPACPADPRASGPLPSTADWEGHRWRAASAGEAEELRVRSGIDGHVGEVSVCPACGAGRSRLDPGTVLASGGPTTVYLARGADVWGWVAPPCRPLPSTADGLRVRGLGDVPLREFDVAAAEREAVAARRVRAGETSSVELSWRAGDGMLVEGGRPRTDGPAADRRGPPCAWGPAAVPDAARAGLVSRAAWAPELRVRACREALEVCRGCRAVRVPDSGAAGGFAYLEPGAAEWTVREAGARCPGAAADEPGADLPLSGRVLDGAREVRLNPGDVYVMREEGRLTDETLARLERVFGELGARVLLLEREPPVRP